MSRWPTIPYSSPDFPALPSPPDSVDQHRDATSAPSVDVSDEWREGTRIDAFGIGEKISEICRTPADEVC
jgi:hypothetical protein